MARLTDALRGGNHAFQAEREAAGLLEAVLPSAPRLVAWSDSWHARAAALAVRGGAGSVIFGAAGFPFPVPPRRFAGVPVTGCLHREAANAGAWCGYPDPDPVTVIVRAGSLGGDDGAVAFEADVTDPVGLLKAARQAGMGGGPVHVQWGLAAACLGGFQAAELAAGYRGLLPPGSTVAMAVPEIGAGVAGVHAHAHTADDVAAWADSAGLVLVSAPEDVQMLAREPLLASPGFRIVAAVAAVP